MGGITAFIYHKDYLKYDFGPSHPLRPIRLKRVTDLLNELKVFDQKLKLVKPSLASDDDLLLVHSKKYIEFVKERSKTGIGLLDYGDTPAFKGVYEVSCLAAGGSLLGADLIMKREFDHAINLGGGFHHASRDRAAGFCVFNDVAISARHLQRRYKLDRIAIVDIDGHHADGTQKTFYKEKILTISFHRYGPLFYPGTGSVEEIGEGDGEGYSINVPLPARTFDEAYLYAFHEIVPPILRAYRPEFIIHQFGVDGYYTDPLVGLSLTTRAYYEIAKEMHVLSHELCDGRYLMLGGGGYSPEDSARCWAVASLAISEAEPIEKEKFGSLFDKVRLPESEVIFTNVKNTVKKLKEKVFLLHNLSLNLK